MVTVMVITCPHALNLAIPLVVAVSTSLPAKNGLLIKNRDGFEQARNVQAILVKWCSISSGRRAIKLLLSRWPPRNQYLLCLPYSVSLLITRSGTLEWRMTFSDVDPRIMSAKLERP